MIKSLVIVESPAKVKTINKILGDRFKVVPSMGHLIDLPSSTFGVDIADGFKPKFIVVRKKQKILKQLKKEAENKKEIYIATDPDREGEAIGWNIVNFISADADKSLEKKNGGRATKSPKRKRNSEPAKTSGPTQKFYRISFHEITKDAVLKALEHPREFDVKKVDAQLARRILDRIVGYQLSPLLWKKVGSRLSAGRVQSVALRLIVEREREIKKFVPQEYWQISVDLQKKGVRSLLTAALEKVSDEKPDLKTESEAKGLAEQIRKEKFIISNIATREVKRNPSPPFITSTLQQEAFNKLGFNAAKTMMVAQQLYEGVDLGDGETVGLITYMRTDSVNIAQEALGKVRALIGKTFGKNYLPESPNVYKSKKSAQEAHEAIRPTNFEYAPPKVRKFLDEDQYKLYELIWRRFLSCQMVPAVFENKKLEIKAGHFQFGASGSTLIFDGYLATDPERGNGEAAVDFSPYEKDDIFNLKEINPTQHFTKPPPRYSEATLVKTLEEAGIGRPSTYAPIIQTLVYRNYALREKGYFYAAELGTLICDLLIEYFPKIMDIGFTATMEEHLDQVEEGQLEPTQLLKEFYGPFKEELDYAMANIEKTQTLIDRNCPHCGRPMAIKWGRKGKFLSCSGFPECKFAQPFTTGVKCPQENCGGELVERRSKRGAKFYGCSQFPACRYIANKLPELKS